MTHLLDTQKALDRICWKASQMPWVSIDTEFERIKTYFPKLCLVQIATPTEIVCVDPLANLDLASLASLLTNSEVLKILHSARQDIEVLNRAIGVSPAPIVDTQIAAHMCGYGEQISYAALVKIICGINLQKQHTRTAWSRRPLTESEITYALDDVRYLGSMYIELKDLLTSFGRQNWLHEDCKGLIACSTTEFGAQKAIRKIRTRACRLSRLGQSIAYQLAIWREATAQTRNRPREWILDSKTLLLIARRASNVPDDVEMGDMLSLFEGRSDILDSVQKGVNQAVNYQCVPSYIQQTALEKRRERILWQELHAICEAVDLSPEVVCSRREIRSLSRGEYDIPLLKGWRGRFVGTTLKERAIQEGAPLSSS